VKGAILLYLIFLIPFAYGFESTEYGLSFDSPDGWIRTDDAYMLAVFKAPTADPYESRISIKVLDRTRTDIDMVVGQIKQTYSTLFTFFSVEDEVNLTVMGLPSREIICTWQQGIYNLKMKELVIQKTNRYYDFGFISTEEEFDADLPVFEGCMESLSFDDPVYADASSGVSFSYPSGWATDDVSFESMIMFYGPEVDGFLTNVVFAQEAWDGDIAGFVEEQETQMAEYLTGYQLHSDGTYALPVGTCRDLTYSYIIPGSIEIRARAVMLCRDGMAYAMVYTTLPSVFDVHLPQYEEMLMSFQIGEVAMALCIVVSIPIFLFRDSERLIR
jgi:hypothetical protein